MIRSYIIDHRLIYVIYSSSLSLASLSFVRSSSWFREQNKKEKKKRKIKERGNVRFPFSKFSPTLLSRKENKKLVFQNKIDQFVGAKFSRFRCRLHPLRTSLGWEHKQSLDLRFNKTEFTPTLLSLSNLSLQPQHSQPTFTPQSLTQSLSSLLR